MLYQVFWLSCEDAPQLRRDRVLMTKVPVAVIFHVHSEKCSVNRHHFGPPRSSAVGYDSPYGMFVRRRYSVSRGECCNIYQRVFRPATTCNDLQQRRGFQSKQWHETIAPVL